jgi:hypothetical protein
MGVNLNEEQVAVLLKYFDKDGSGQIDLNEFMVAIRVSIQTINTFILLIFILTFSGSNERC